MATAASPAAYYKLNLNTSRPVETSQVLPLARSPRKPRSRNISTKSSVEDSNNNKYNTYDTGRSHTPVQQRSWFDDATANSLERQQHKRRKSQPGPFSHTRGSHTLPRSLRSSPAASHLSQSSDWPLSGRSTPSHLNTTASMASCDSINLALNNALGPNPQDSAHSDRCLSPIELVKRGSPVSRHSSDEQSQNSRSRAFSPSPLSAVPGSRVQENPRQDVTDGRPSPSIFDNKDDDIQLTRDLVEAIKELKDIAEVARVIDDVDDEEWLLMFIGELEVHLNDLIKMDAARQNESNLEKDPIEEMELQKVERQEKKTLLSVALDLIRYLKDRTSYALQRRSMVDSRDNKTDDAADDTSCNTLVRLKSLAAEKPCHPSSMNKWQRRLSNLADTLDKYLQRLESVTSNALETPEENPLVSASTPSFQTTSTPKSQFYFGQSPHFSKWDLKSKENAESQDKHTATNGLVVSPQTYPPVAKARNYSKLKNSLNGDKSDLGKRSVHQYDPMAPQHSKANRKKSSSGDSGYEDKPLTRFVSSGSETEMFDPPNDSKPRVIVDMTNRKHKGLSIVALSSKTSPKDSTQPGEISKSTSSSSPTKSETVYGVVVSSLKNKNKPQISVKELTAKYNAPSERGRSPNKDKRHQVVAEHSHPPESQHLSGICLFPKQNRHRRGGSLDRATWKKERSTWSGKTRDDSTLVPDTSNHLSGYSRLCDYSRSLTVPSESRSEAKSPNKDTLISEFKMQVNAERPQPQAHDEVDGHTTQATLRRKEPNRSNYEPETKQTPSETAQIMEELFGAVLEEDVEASISCPHARAPTAERIHGNRSFRDDSTASRTSISGMSVSSRMSASSQCNIVSSDNLEKADQEVARLKKRSSLLQRGLTEAREERDEKDRRIAVLESRLQRLKKSMESGRTEHGSVQDELSHLRRLLNQEMRDSQLQISELENKLRNLESKIQRDQKKIDDLSQKVEQLQTDNLSLRKRCEDLLKDKSILEEKLHDATMTLMRERRHSRKLQQENVRLEEELTKANEALSAEKAVKERLSTEVSEIIRSSEEIVREVALGEQGEYPSDVVQEEFDELREENLQLAKENRELRETLSNEQDMTAATTDCFRQQIEFLSSEVSMQQEAVRTQRQLYEEEIERLLKTKEATIKPSTSSGELAVERMSLHSQIEYEQTITRTLYIENERLRTERDELLERIVSFEKGAKKDTETVDFGCQVEDTSYMRMRAFDFYANEAQRDARRLLDRGRQLQEEGLRQSMQTQRLQVEVLKKTPLR